MVLFSTIGLFGQLAGLSLSTRLGVVSTAVVIALVARLERPRPPMPGGQGRRTAPLHRSATWISWLALILLLAIRVPTALVLLAALLPVLGVHLNTSQMALTSPARRVALGAPVLAQASLMVAVVAGFGHAPLWLAGVGVWTALALFAGRLGLSLWLAALSREGHHERVLPWLYSWPGGLVDPAIQCHVLVLSGNLEQAARLQTSLGPRLRTSIQSAMAWVAVDAAQGANTTPGFNWISIHFPTHPHGPLGLCDAALAQGEPAEDWAVLAQDLAKTSLWSRSLLSIADANLARALAGDEPRARDQVTEMLAENSPDLSQLTPAALHRLALAAEQCNHPRSNELWEFALQSDADGLIGQSIRSRNPPLSLWL